MHSSCFIQHILCACVYVCETCHYWHLHLSLLLSCWFVLFLSPSPFVSDTIIRLVCAVILYGTDMQRAEKPLICLAVSISLCIMLQFQFFCPSKVNTVSGWMIAPHCINNSNQSIHVLSRNTLCIAVFFMPNIPLIWSQWQVTICCKLCHNKQHCLI